MRINYWEWEEMGLKKIFPLIFTSKWPLKSSWLGRRRIFGERVWCCKPTNVVLLFLLNEILNYQQMGLWGGLNMQE